MPKRVNSLILACLETIKNLCGYMLSLIAISCVVIMVLIPPLISVIVSSLPLVIAALISAYILKYLGII